MPPTEEVYVHRVGRTARAGKKGRALSLIGESGFERKLLKSIVKHSPQSSCKHRVISRDSIVMWKEKISKMSQAIVEISSMETEERAERLAQMEIDKAENIVNFTDEINSRPARTWFLSEKQKQIIKSEDKRIIDDLIGATYKEQTPNTGETTEETKPDLRIYRPARIPSLPHRPSRRERRRAAEKDEMLTPSRYNLAKKKNRALSKIDRNSSKSKRPMAKKQKTAMEKRIERVYTGSERKTKKRAGSFKSKKKHKRR